MLTNENALFKNEGLSFSRSFNDDSILLSRKIHSVNNSNYFIFFFEKKSDYAILKLFEKYVFLITIPIFDHYNIITQHWWIKRGQSSFPPFCIQFFFKKSRTTEKSFLFFLICINLLICKVFM